MSEAKPRLSRQPPATFAALRYPNYRRWFVGQVLSLMGTWMQSVAQGWLVFQLTGSEFALGAITFAGSLPTLILMLPAGAIIDRLPKRKLLMWTQAAQMACAFILAVLTFLKVLQVWQIGVLAVALGIANSFDAPARLALTPEMVDDRRDLQNAVALGATMFNLARVVGPAIGGLILASMGAAWCFFLNGLSFLAVLIALALMVLPNDVGKPKSDRKMTHEIGDGLNYVWNHQIVRTIIILIGVSTLFGFSYSVLLPAYASSVLNVGEAGYGLMNAAVGVGALIGSLIVASMTRSQRQGRQLTIGSLIFPLALIAFVFIRSFPLVLVCLGVVGLGFVTQNATANTLVQMLSPDHLRGRVMSVYSLMFFGATPFGSLMAGAAAQRWGPGVTVGVTAVLCLLFALGVMFFVPQLRRMRFDTE
jgi:MFS family permease